VAEELMSRKLTVHVVSTGLACVLMIATSLAQTTKDHQKVTTIVGCLANKLDQGISGDPQSESHANDFFVRTPTVALPVGSTVAIGKPGTASATPSAGTPAADSFYRITGLAREQLQPHLGHRVELQGHLSANPTAGTTAKTTVDASGKPTTRVEQRPMVAGVLHATAITMVSATCP
jgi:hypothetical protein